MASDSAYKVPKLPAGGIHRVEQTIKRSRFITSLGRARSPEEAKEFIERVKAEFPDARHNCWAFAAGAPGNTAKIGASDDGEPHGTAGRPMLNILLHGGVGEVAVVVTRYFGGILLGTGGLVRAYQSSVKNALDTLPTEDRVETEAISVTLEHRYVTQFLRIAAAAGASIEGQDFGLDAEYTLAVPQNEKERLIKELTELTSGSVLIEEEEDPS